MPERMGEKQVTASSNIPDKYPKPGKAMPIPLVLVFVVVALIVITSLLGRFPGFSFFAEHAETLISAEMAVGGMILVELTGRVIVRRFAARGMAPVGYSLRAILRGTAYIALTVAVVSVLAASPALAISIGTVSGVIIGFAVQNIIGNVFAGMLLVVVRPVRVGDHVSIGGASGSVKEIDLIYTIVDAGENWYYVPSMSMFSNTVMRKKRHGEKTPDAP